MWTVAPSFFFLLHPKQDILLQLKRTVEVVSVQKATEGGGGQRGRIKRILDSALSAGKAARNERVVPEIRKLREYGPDGTPPSSLARVVAEVRDCIWHHLECYLLTIYVAHDSLWM